MTSATLTYVCPKCGKEQEATAAVPKPLCIPCDYQVMHPKDLKKTLERKVSVERVISQGLLTTMPHEERERAEQVIKNLNQVMDSVPREVALVAFMVFSCDFTEKYIK